MATTDLIGAISSADHQGQTLADRLAHEASSHVSWRAIEARLRETNANGRILTAGEAWIGDRVGHIADIEVTVEYVSPVSPDGDVFLVLRSLDRTGTALAVTDAAERPDALGWMDRSIVRLTARATLLFGQPAIDLRRNTAIHGSVTANTAPLPQDAVAALERALAVAGQLHLIGGGA